MRLGVLGGTFDPVHYGHLRLAESARQADGLKLDKILFIPAGHPWRKSGRAISSPIDRAAMLRLAIEGNDAFEMSMLEIEREGPSYTVDTLKALLQKYPGCELFLIMGEDALADLPNWREPARIKSLARLAVASRASDSPAAGSEAPPQLAGDTAASIPMEPLQISGSGIREKVRRRLSIRYLVPEPVRLYIEEHGLYVR